MSRSPQQVSDDFLGILLVNGHKTTVQHLKEYLAIIAESDSEEERSRARQYLVSLCHPKALGDLFTKGHSWPQWLSMVDDFGKAVRAL